MIYLILDTNIWLYLANGLDPLTSKHHDDLHFTLLEGLKELKNNNDVIILVNEIIIAEWMRNKEHSKAKIKKLKSKLANPDNSFNELKKYVKSQTDNLKEEYIEGLRNDIKANEQHIENVEAFLLQDCISINIPQEIKIKIFDLSVLNKAPFHNKKNNIADASILFSSTDYLKDKLFGEDVSAIFISNNIEDFTDGKNKNDFHPDIKETIGGIPITYERVLPAALNVSKAIIQEIEEYRKKEIWLESISFSCKTQYCEGNEYFSPWGYLSQTLKVYDETESVNPNQLVLFDDLEPIKKEALIVKFGECINCGTTHIECPECGELTYIENESDEFQCMECEANLRINEKNKEMYLFVDTQAEE